MARPPSQIEANYDTYAAPPRTPSHRKHIGERDCPSGPTAKDDYQITSSNEDGLPVIVRHAAAAAAALQYHGLALERPQVFRVVLLLQPTPSSHLSMASAKVSHKPQPTIGRILFSGLSSVRPSVRALTPISYNAVSLYVVDGIQGNLPQIFITRAGTAEKVFKVRGQRSRS